MRQQALVWLNAAKEIRYRNWPNFYRLLIFLLIAPILVTVTSPLPQATAANEASVTAPENVSASVSGNSVIVSWSSPFSGSGSVTGYRVEYSTDGISWSLASGTVASNATSYTISGLVAASYYVRVAAVTSGNTIQTYGYPWTKIYATTTPYRTTAQGSTTVSNNGYINYTSGFGLASASGQAANTYASSSFSRIKYRLEYSTGTTQWVETDFNKWSSQTNLNDGGSTYSTDAATLSNISIPDKKSNQFIIQANVSDLNSVSNVSGINLKGTNGRVEIWPYDYNVGLGSTSNGSDGSESFFDYNDKVSPSTSTSYGSFQVHDRSNGQTLFAWNRHGTTSYDLAIKPVATACNGTTTYDFTFCGNTGKSAFKLEISVNVPVTVTNLLLTYLGNSNSTGTAPPVVSAAPGSSVTLATNSGGLTRTGYAFGGWNTSADGSGTNYSVSTPFTLSSNTTLYARWFPIVTFNGNGSTTEVSKVPSEIQITKTTASNSLPIAYGLGKSNFTFGGWNTNETGTGTSYPGSNINLVGLPTPYLRLEASNFDTTTNTWIATNGSNIASSNMISSANISKVEKAGLSSLGITETFTVVKGTNISGIRFGNPKLGSSADGGTVGDGWTFCSVARIPTATAPNNTALGGRLFDALNVNWLTGWWAGYQNRFWHGNRWINADTTANDTKFHLICDRKNSSRWDGSQSGDTLGGDYAYLPELSINYGYFTNGGTVGNTNEKSDWEVAEVLMYSTTLTDVQVQQVEAYLKYRYGIMAASSTYSAGTAVSNFQTQTPLTLYARWNSVVTYNGNGNTSGTAPASQTISGTSGTLATNSGSLVKGINAFLGWYTNAAGTGGTFYPAGASYPNSGNTTLYATYGPALSISGGSTATFTTGVGGVSETFTMSGGVGNRIISNVVSPANSGITLDTSTANTILIRVSPTVGVGTYVDTFTVRDDGFTVSKSVTITVSSPLIWSSSNPSTVTTTYGKPTRTRLDLSGGAGTRTATITHLTSPAPRGITLDTSTIAMGYIHLVTDTGTAVGTYMESITVTDSTRAIRTFTLTVIVNSLPSIAYPTAGNVPDILRSNLLVRYEMDSSTSYTGTGTTVYDLMSNSNGLVSGNPTFSRDYNGYLTMNGSHYIQTRTGLTSTQIGENISVFMWVYPTGNGVILDERGQVNANGTVLDGWQDSHIEVVSGSFKFRVWNMTSAQAITHTVSGGVSNKGWYYVGYTYNKSTLTFTAYVNGVAVGSLTNFDRQAPYEYSNTQHFAIGKADATNMGDGTDGKFYFGAFHLYSVPLSAADVLDNFRVSQGRFTFVSFAGSTTLRTTAGLETTFSVFTGLNGTGTKTFSSLVSPSTPGITTNSTGLNTANVVVGSSVVAGTYTDTLTATDANNQTATYVLNITVNPKIAITATTDTVTTTFGRVAYDTLTTTANTGTGNITFTRTSSSGSSAITYTSTVGSPAQAVMTIGANLPAGTYYETFTATDSLGATTIKVITIIVNPALTLTSATGSNRLETTFGKAASLTINVANGTGTRKASALPVVISGVSLTTTNLQSGSLVLALTNTVAAGSYVETITVSDSLSASTSLVITIVVNPAPTISYGGATSGALTFTTTQGGNLQSSAFTAALGTGTRRLTISGTNPGITIDTSTANTAVLTFGPSMTATNSTTPKTYTETITVFDSLSVTASRTISIVVNPPIILAATTTTVTTTSGIESSTVITATQGTGNRTFVRASTATSGLSLTQGTNQATLKVLSTANPGTYWETITASDTSGATTNIAIKIVVNPGPTISGSSKIIAVGKVAYTSSAYTAQQGTGLLRFTSLEVSPVNSGVTLDSATSGSAFIKVANTVESSTTYSLILRVTDAVGATSAFSITLVVNPPLALTGTQTITKTYGEPGTYQFNTNGGTAPFTFGTTGTTDAANICAREISVSGGVTTELIKGVGSCNWQVPAGVTSLTGVLVVGGGGGGGWGSIGGGGGAGEVESSTSAIAVSPGNRIALTVGGGGSDGFTFTEGTWSSGSTGGDSSFGTVIALGGGAGAGNGGTFGGNGGSGGGANSSSTTGGTSTKSSQTGWISYGNNGAGSSGGGGGAGAAATDKTGGAGITLMGMTFAGGGSGWASPFNVAGGSGGGGYSRGKQSNPPFPCTISNGNSLCAGLAGTGSGGGAGGRGGSGFVAIQYLTPTASADSSTMSYSVTSKSPTGQLVLSIPENVPAGTYSQTIRVSEDTVVDNGTTIENSITVLTYNVTITINKATPTATLSLPGAVTTAKYGSPVTITAAVSTPGVVNFKKTGSGAGSLTGCSAVATSNGLATCTWTPSAVETITLSAILTPTDITNYNTSVESASNITVIVGRADTLTVTATNLTATYSESSGSATTTIPARTYSLTGLASIDSITAMSYDFEGTINGGASYATSANAPTLAGTYTITPKSPVFSPGATANYSKVDFIAGTLTINRASRGSWSVTYGSGTNTITYGASKSDTPTLTFPGDGARLFSTTSTTCSVNASTGVLTTLGVGACDIEVVLAQTNNWLSDTKTVTVTINRGLRTATLTPAHVTIKYGETTSVTSTISPELDAATVTYSAGSSLGCTIDNVSGFVTGTKAGASCSVSVIFDQTTLYESATATAALTINKASAPIVTTDSITAISYTGSTTLLTPTYSLSGILPRDITALLPTADVSSSAAIASIPAANYTTISGWRYFATTPTNYDSTTAPTLGGTYAVTAQNLTLLGGLDISNYETPTYVASSLVISPIAQAPIRIQLAYLESVTVPYDVTITGGSSSVAPTLAVIAGGSAQGCDVDTAISAMRLKSSSPGTCIIQVTKPADRNYLIALSDTQTVTILNFVINIIQLFDNNPTGITINSEVPIVVGDVACTLDCVPTITAIQDMSGNEMTDMKVGIPFRIIGTNFNTATKVLFTATIGGSRRSAVAADSFQIDSDTQITVLPPTSFVPNGIESTSTITVRVVVVASGGQSFPNSSITTISL